MYNMIRNIYFAGSIRGGRADRELYASIVNQLKEYGHVFTEHIASPEIVDAQRSDKYIHDRDIKWLEESDVLVAECTQPSLGVGYEVGRAVSLKKKILILFRPDSGKHLSAMVAGASVDGLPIACRHYKEEQLPKILKEFFSTL